MDSHDVSQSDSQEQDVRLSYKFQRLRERLRQAIESGELSGKLPGERQLSRRFRVNAKTLSKALTDLAAEGVLERSIGRGTFVRGQQPAAQPAQEKWLLICEPEQIHAPVVQAILQSNPATQIATDVSAMRPSFINQFKAVIDFATATPEAFLRSLIVRNITLVAVGREPRTYSSHAVLVDRVLGASLLGRDLMLGGHTKLFAVERIGQTLVTDALRRAAARYAPDVVVDSGGPKDVSTALEHGVTAFVCGTRALAEQVREQLERLCAQIPTRVSLAAVGTGWGEYPCSGYFVHASQKADAVMQILNDKNAHRPVTVWLTGQFMDCGTIAASAGDRAIPHIPIAPRVSTATA